MGKKGQVIIPKKMRDEDGLEEDDKFVVTHMPGGDIILRPVNIETPEEKMMRVIARVPKFDARKAWEEVVHINPFIPLVHERLAVFYEKAGERQKAQREREAARAFQGR